jgi:hypothetical protein
MKIISLTTRDTDGAQRYPSHIGSCLALFYGLTNHTANTYGVQRTVLRPAARAKS